MIRYGDSLIEGRLVRRYKRFFADVELAGGEVVTAHCPNPGSMKSCALVGGRVWLSESDNPKRKLRYTWELARVGGQMVVINTARGNQLMADALERRRIAELAPYDRLRREVKLGDSRIDFVTERSGRTTWIEVKSVTLAAEPGVAAFPDSVTERGTRHLQELIRARRRGDDAALLFCVSRSKVRRVRPADEIDPTYGETLRRAAAAGVAIIAYGCRVGTRQLSVDRALPVDL